MNSEWIEYNKPWKDYEGECFLYSGLCQTGTIIETDNGNTYLVGDINEEGGTCKCCNAFTMDTIIKRYKILNREEETDTENIQLDPNKQAQIQMLQSIIDQINRSELNSLAVMTIDTEDQSNFLWYSEESVFKILGMMFITMTQISKQGVRSEKDFR